MADGGKEKPSRPKRAKPWKRRTRVEPAAPQPAAPASPGRTIIIQQQQTMSGSRGVPDQRLLLFALGLGSIPFFLGLTTWSSGDQEAWIPLIVVGGLCGLAAIFLSAHAIFEFWSVPGYGNAKVLAIIAFAFGTLSFGLFIVLPLIALLFCRPEPTQSCNCAWPAPAGTCDCGPCCEGPSGCGGCGEGSGCCSGGEESSSSGGGCCGSSSGSGSGSNGGSSPNMGVVGTGAALAAATAKGFFATDVFKERLRAGHFAHHPDLPQFVHDVFTIRGTRVCIGCFITFPAFLLLLPFESLLVPLLGWKMAFFGGLGLALVQGISSLGWARWRWMKIVVKSCLGAGLALFLLGLRAAPWSLWLQSVVLGTVLALALLSTVPRRRRIAKAICAAGTSDGGPIRSR